MRTPKTLNQLASSKALHLLLVLAITLTAVLSASSFTKPVYAASKGPNGEVIPAGYEMAKDSDFIIYPPAYRSGRAQYQYIGTKSHVVIPHKIKGVTLKDDDLYHMFRGEEAKHIRGVASDNPKLTSTWDLFADNPAPSLDLRHFDTSNIETMLGMFSGTKATTINLSNWKTSKVWSMTAMFKDSKVKSLNLNHFDFSSLITAESMFENAGISSLTISKFNLAPASPENARDFNYASIRHMFARTKNLKSVDLRGLDVNDYRYEERTNHPPSNALVLHSAGVFHDSNVRTVRTGNAATKKLLQTDWLHWQVKPKGFTVL